MGQQTEDALTIQMKRESKERLKSLETPKKSNVQDAKLHKSQARWTELKKGQTDKKASDLHEATSFA